MATFIAYQECVPYQAPRCHHSTWRSTVGRAWPISHSPDIQLSRPSIGSAIVSSIALPGFDRDAVSAFIHALASLLFPSGRYHKCFGDPLTSGSQALAGHSGSNLRFD